MHPLSAASPRSANPAGILRARALKKKCDLAALVRELVEAYVVDELHVATLASEIHDAKGFGKIIGDCK